MAKTRLASCRHEAAHAIIAQRFGLRIKRVHVPLLPGKHKGGRGFVEYGDARRIGPVQFGCIMAAGSLAEHIWHGTPKGSISAYDFEDMRRLGIKGEDFRIIWEETSRLVRENKKKIWALADRVMAGKIIKL